MDVDYQIEKDMVILTEKEPLKEKRKRQRKVLQTASENLATIVIEKLSGRVGDC